MTDAEEKLTPTPLTSTPDPLYQEDKIVTLNPMEHIRLRPGMYIGKLGDGTAPDDGIYVLLSPLR